MSTKKKLLFIFVFGPALLVRSIAFVFTAFRLSWELGCDECVELLELQLESKRETK